MRTGMRTAQVVYASDFFVIPSMRDGPLRRRRAHDLLRHAIPGADPSVLSLNQLRLGEVAAANTFMSQRRLAALALRP
jgi:hypothetical protein